MCGKFTLMDTYSRIHMRTARFTLMYTLTHMHTDTLTSLWRHRFRETGRHYNLTVLTAHTRLAPAKLNTGPRATIRTVLETSA